AHLKLWTLMEGGGSPVDKMRRGEEEWERVRDNAFDVLTADQQKQWRKLTGTPLQGQVRFMVPAFDGMFLPPPPVPGGFGPKGPGGFPFFPPPGGKPPPRP